MIGRGDGDGVNVLANFVEQLAVVAVLLELRELAGELLGLRPERPGVHVADGDNVAAALGGIAAVAVTFAADADAGDVDAVIGAQHTAHVGEAKRGRARGEQGAAEELATGEGDGFGHSS